MNLDAADAPAGEMDVVLGARVAGHPAARGDRPRPRGRLQPQRRVRLHRPLGKQVASPLCTVVDDGTIAESPRLAQRRRRGHADQAHRAHRERHPARLPAGPPQRAPDGDRADRQRPARELRAHADAAHDQHLHAGRRIDARGDHPLGRSTASTRSFGGGQVDITNGKFVFSATEAYLIEDGKITRRSRARR